jgi:hypothetical protein
MSAALAALALALLRNTKALGDIAAGDDRVEKQWHLSKHSVLMKLNTAMMLWHPASQCANKLEAAMILWHCLKTANALKPLQGHYTNI